MKNMSKVWPVLISAVALIAALFLFGNTLLLYIAPKVVLSAAVTSAFSQLENRFQNSPLSILANTLDPEGSYTIDAVLCSEQDLLGEISYDMIIQTDSSSHQFSVEGTISAASTPLDISLYVDTEFIAISCPDLVTDNYYGITYGTFSGDIRRIPLLNFIISDSLLQKWNNSILEIQEMAAQDFTVNAPLGLDTNDIQDLILKILALPSQVEKQAVLPNGTIQDCYRISYHIPNELLSKYADGYPLEQYQEIIVSFFIHERSLVFAEVTCSGTQTSTLGIDLGHAPQNEDIYIQLESSVFHPLESIGCKISTQRTDNNYAESWILDKIENGNAEKYKISYFWNPVTGNMTIQTTKEENPIKLTLIEEEGSVVVASEQFPQLLRALKFNIPEKFTNMLTGQITVTKGSQIITPTYKNLDQWSLEDFLKLLEGIGSVMGIDMGM